jgi:hypothetical protein
MRVIGGCVYAAHHQYEAACHNWQSVIETGCRLLSRADMRQFTALCDDDYFLCRDEHHLYNECEEVTRARPRYISIMSGLVTEEAEQEMNDKENHYDKGADKDLSQAFFLVYHQLMAYHCWLLFHWEEAALF